MYIILQYIDRKTFPVDRILNCTRFDLFYELFMTVADHIEDNHDSFV